MTMKQEENQRSLFFRARLSSLIQERGITQRELASAVKITPQSISNYIRGTRSLPAAEELLALAQYFRVSMESLISEDAGQHDEKTEPTKSTRRLPKKFRQAIEKIARISDELRVQVADLKESAD